MRKMKSDAGVSPETTVDRHFNTGDKCRSFVIQQVTNGTDEVLLHTESFHRGMVENFVAALGQRTVRIAEQSCVLMGLKEARSNGVNTDAALCKVNSEVFCEVGNTCFGSRISRNLGHRGSGSHGRNV